MLLEVTKNHLSADKDGANAGDDDATSQRLVERRQQQRRTGSFAASEVALQAAELSENVRTMADQRNGGSKNGKTKKRKSAKAMAAAAAEDEATRRDSDELKPEEEANATSVADVREEASQEKAEEEAEGAFKPELVWTNIGLFVVLHSCLPVGVYMLVTQWPWKTLLFSILGMYASGLGVTGGSHRLWSHRSYKASWPVQVLLVVLQTMAGQNSIYTWSRDHRVHHKFAETDADPHNIKRGFFFAHMGWLCCKKHPDVKEKGKLIDMSDLEANPYVMFQHRHFWWMSALFTVLVPTMLPVWLWGERFWTSFVFSFMVRYLITLHGTWLVNSAAHYYGHRPYDKRIEARESPYVIFNGLGEGFHNYHHTFPYDYATSEFGKYMNITTTFIDLCASLGLVRDRRKVDRESILRRRARTGDSPPAIQLAHIDEEEASRSMVAYETDHHHQQQENNNNNLASNQAERDKEQPEVHTKQSVGESLANCGRLLVDNWRLSSSSLHGAASAVVQDSGCQQSSLISMIHA